MATGQNPRGQIKPRNGVDDDLRFENLIEVRRGRDPFGAITDKHSKGGKRSSLHERQASDAALLRTLAEHQGALTVPQLSQSLGQSAPCCCTRLAKLERSGLVCGPHCNARRRWNLTAKGEALALSPKPVVLDDLDHDILRIIARSQTKLMKIVAQTGVCRLTARRRVNLMVERKLVESDGRRFSITDEGRKALGAAAPQPWVRPEAVAAANAKDVLTRGQDDRTTAQRGAHSSMGAAKGAATVRLRKSQTFNAFPERLMTG